MIYHTAVFEFSTPLDAEQLAHITQQVTQLQELIPAVRSIVCGPDLGVRNGNASFGVMATFAERADLVSYIEDPAHIKVSRNVLGPHVKTKLVTQFEF